MLNMRNGKNRKMISTIVVVILVLAMVLPTVLGACLSLFM